MDIDNCDVNSNCTNTIGNFTCTCNEGYEGNGIQCSSMRSQINLLPFALLLFLLIDIDECYTEQLNSCHGNATCNDTDGSYECYCNDGFYGDGVVCNDIDECAANLSQCDAKAFCVNNNGSYKCFCFPGYLGNGYACDGKIRQYRS